MSCTVDITCEDRIVCPLSFEEISQVCEFVLREEGVDGNCFVSVSLVSDESIRGINDTWRGKDCATDVISLECERPEDVTGPDEPCELGDIVLAPAYIERQAVRYGVPVGQEFRLLLVHGMLHLLGYDHLAEDEAEEMELREDELLTMLMGLDHVAHTTLTRHQGDDAI